MLSHHQLMMVFTVEKTKINDKPNLNIKTKLKDYKFNW